MARNLTDGGPRLSDEELDQVIAPGEFSKGLRRGGHFALSNLKNVTGAVAEGLGADEFAKARYAGADESMGAATAPELAPAVHSLRDIGSVGQAGQWLAGKAGEMAPVAAGLIGATAFTGGAVPAALAGTAAMTPFEVGDVVGRQRAAGGPVNLRDAAVSGVGSAALQAALPAVARARLGGAGIRAPGGSAAIIPEQAALTGGSELVKQQGAQLGAAPDWAMAGEAALEGGILGVPFAGMHALGSRAGQIRDAAGTLKDKAGEALGAAKERLAPVGEALGTAKDKAGEALGAVKEQAGEALGAAKERYEGFEMPNVAEIPDKLGELLKSGKAQARTWMDRVAKGEDTMADPAELAGQGRTDADIAKAAEADDQTRVSKITEWARELYNEKLTPEQRASIEEFQANTSDRAAQAKVAAMRAGKEAWERASPSIRSFAARIADAADGAADAAEKLRGKLAKKTEFSPADRAVAEAVTPVLQRARPDLFDGRWNAPEEDMQTLASGVRRLVADIASGKQPSSDALLELMAVTGNKSADVIEAAYRALGSEGFDAKATARVYDSLIRVAEQDKRQASLVESLRGYLDPRYARSVDGPMLQELATGLQRWASKGFGKSDDPMVAYKNNKLKDLIDEHFGKNADAVFAAVEKSLPKEKLAAQRPGADEQGIDYEAPLDAEIGDTKVQLHTAKSGEMFLHPDHAGKSPYGAAAEQRMNKLNQENTANNARLVTAKELGDDHPIVERMRNILLERANKAAELVPGLDVDQIVRQELDKYVAVATDHPDNLAALTGSELKGMKLDQHAHRNSPGRLETGVEGTTLDAVKVTKTMMKRFGGESWSESDRSYPLRLAHMFMEGVAAAQAHLNRAFEVPDSTVIGYLPGGKALTWKQAKKLDPRVGEAWGDRITDEMRADLESLRKEYRSTKDEGRRNALAKQGKALAEELENRKNKELTQEARRDREEGVRQDVDPFGEIHQAGDYRGAVEPINSGITGFGRGNEGGAVRGSPEPAPKQPAADWRATADAMLAKDDYSSLKTKAGVDRFLTAAKKRYDELKAADAEALKKDELLPAQQRKALITLEDMFGERATRDLASFYDGIKDAAAPKAAPKAEAAPSADKQAAWANKLLSKPVLEARAEINKLNQTQLDNFLTYLEDNWETIPTKSSQENVRLKQIMQHVEERVSNKEAPPDPKVVAAKKAAFVEKARSGDKALLDELSQSDDAKGLQRAISALLKEQGTKRSENVERVIETANERLATLLREDPSLGYNMQTKRYSLESVRIHEELEQPGFPATHDSPFKHEGKFDWRANLGKSGSGGTSGAKGAGTYLSTGDTTHRYYKGLFSALAKDEGGKSPTYHVSVDIPQRQILSWDKPVSEQAATVKLRLQQAAKEQGLELPKDATGEQYYRALSKKLGDDAKASDYLQKLGILGHEYLAADGKNKTASNYVIYDDSRIRTNYVHFSQEGVSAERSNLDRRKAVEDYIHTRLGPDIEVLWKKFSEMPHAGEYERISTPDPSFYRDVVRLSMHSLNPMSTAYHETLHGFFQHLTDMKLAPVMDVLNRAAESAPVMNQLRKLMQERGFNKEALAQLSNPEERAAYMFQFWAEGKLKVGPQTQTVLGKIVEFVRSVLGLWSNDQRATRIMEYLHSGEYGKDIGKRDLDMVLERKLLEPGRNKTIEAVKKMTEPFRDLGEAMFVVGGQRLRDTGVPALRELADAVKRHGGDVGDPGFVPAAGAEHRRRMNKLYQELRPFSEAQIHAAIESLQSKSDEPIKALADAGARGNARSAKIFVRKALDDAFNYMRENGVKVNDLGYGKDYFPRVYNPDYISRHQQQFIDVLEKHNVANADKLMKRIIAGEGSEMTVETDKPGMQFLKPRLLAHIPDAELAPFMERDGLRVLNSYMQQATRRAEWAKRFNDDSSGLHAMLARAERQGATTQDLDAARKFVRAVDGTLGDTINPEARRLMGNMIVYQNLRLLPLGIFSSVVDPLGMVVRGGKVSDAFEAFKRGAREIAKNFQKDTEKGKDAATQFAEDIGTIENTMLVRTLGALYSQGMVGDTGRKINDTLFRYNFMEQYNSSMRVAATEAAMGFLKRHADGKSSPHSLRYLQELGLQPGDVKLGADGRVKVFEHEGLSAEEAAKMRVAVNRWVDGAVLRPDAVDVPVWMNDPHFALLAHLKRFMFSFQETILKRAVHEWQHGNYAPAMALTSYVPVMIASDLLKGMIQGGGEQPDYKDKWTLADYVQSGVERSGLYGTGQFAVDALGDIKRGGSGVGALTGPTIEQLTDAVRVLGGRQQFDTFALRSMPANSLYSRWGGVSHPDPTFVD